MDRILVLFALAASSTATAQVATPQAGFPVRLVSGSINTPDSQVRFSSPVLADLTNDGRPEIIVGTADGVVWAIRSGGDPDGNGPQSGVLWATKVSTSPIESRPAVADINLDGIMDVVVGVGSTLGPPTNITAREENNGALVVLRGDSGVESCRFIPREHPGTTPGPEGIYSSAALADIDGNDGGRLEIIVGGWDFRIYALHDNCTVFWAKAEPDLVIDTTWSSPALGNLDGAPGLEVAIGTDSHVEPQTPQTGDGGMVHVFRGDGSGSLPGFPKHLDEVVFSSPTLADLNADGALDIVVGTGNCWEKAGCAPPRPSHPVDEKVYAFQADGANVPGWPFDLPDTEYMTGQAAVVDIDGNGQLDVVFNTIAKNTAGEDFNQPSKVYVVRADGTVRPGWPAMPGTPQNCSSLNAVNRFTTNGSAVVGDVIGTNQLEVVIGSGADVVIFNRDGVQQTRNGLCLGLTVAVTEPSTIDSTVALGDLDNDGDVEIVASGWRVASPGDSLRGQIYAFDMPSGVTASSLPWPMMKRDPVGHSRVDSTVASQLIFANGFE